MPLQHASASVLKRMKRGASGDIFLKLLERIRRTIPGVAIRTSFIVGFPGETDADFETLVPVRAGGADSTASASSPIPTKTPARSYALDGKVDAAPSTIASAASCRSSARSPAPATAHWWAAKSRCWWKDSLPRPIFCGKAACPRQAPEIDGVTFINDFEGDVPQPRRDPPPAHHRSPRLRCQWAPCLHRTRRRRFPSSGNRRS